MSAEISNLIQESLSSVIVLILVLFALILVFQGVKVVPQSRVYVVERFGKYTKTLSAGLNFIVPFLDRVAHRVSVLERQLPEFEISVITRDNVEVRLEATVFYRVLDAASSVYRINNIDQAIYTAATSIVRSAAGKLELDELQSSRESMNAEIAKNLQQAAEVWGIEITRTEITDVIIDEQTKDAQRQQLNAERQRRAAIAKAEGDKRSVELAADAMLYEAQKDAEATRVQADAKAYAVKVAAEADAEQTRLVAKAIAENGQAAVDFEIMKRQVEALGWVASADNSKTIIVPTDIAGAVGSLQVLAETLAASRRGN
ncbi:MAG: SPFH domain-containing protein [Alphaproteobacteria bacterium]|uniref:SPFH domain-containing protein n=1 Tax=Pacificispira sp. TaxID=2888761 RepID=UPI001B05C227|nr:SPFH/Band 7/PHB domain protein [Alphaproteobacteria bacterium]MBO6864007.1 SPFH/Band 7/PHB domain protein [Alphaproteobacteria bacterium]MEC9266878.1 SPFH domain-containing protein [Pseudomonadota bacterium]